MSVGAEHTRRDAPQVWFCPFFGCENCKTVNEGQASPRPPTGPAEHAHVHEICMRDEWKADSSNKDEANSKYGVTSQS